MLLKTLHCLLPIFIAKSKLPFVWNKVSQEMYNLQTWEKKMKIRMVLYRYSVGKTMILRVPKTAEICKFSVCNFDPETDVNFSQTTKLFLLTHRKLQLTGVN